MCLFMLCVLCLSVLVNSLLNVFAIYVDEAIVFSLKVIYSTMCKPQQQHASSNNI